MSKELFDSRLKALEKEYNAYIAVKNEKAGLGNGVYDRYVNPVLTSRHVPLHWRYDISFADNPFLMERLGVNCVFNPGAIEFNGKMCMAARVEGYDRKSFFAIAESDNGIDNFKFWDEPIIMPETENPDTNVYDMRLIRHQDGWIYGLFCTERKNPTAPPGDMSSAIAQCGVARTKDLVAWERLADIKTKATQQRNVVLHPEFVNGKYAFYTRPADDFMEVGTGGGIGFGLSESIENVVIDEELIMDKRIYHTIKEQKNGQGPAPIKTPKGWLHIAHGVRNTAAGMRYVLYVFLSDLAEPWKVTHTPGGHFIAPEGEERVGDVSNVIFCNGAVARDNGDVFIYYASSDTRCHVATTTVPRLLDYVLNTPPDGLRSYASAQQRVALIRKNKQLAGGKA